MWPSTDDSSLVRHVRSCCLIAEPLSTVTTPIELECLRGKSSGLDPETTFPILHASTEVIQMLRWCCMLLGADDTAIVLVAPTTSERELRDISHRLEEWAASFGLRLDPMKTEVLVWDVAHIETLTDHLTLGTSAVVSATQIKTSVVWLGVRLSSNWESNVWSAASKARMKLPKPRTLVMEKLSVSIAVATEFWVLRLLPGFMRGCEAWGVLVHRKWAEDAIGRLEVVLGRLLFNAAHDRSCTNSVLCWTLGPYNDQYCVSLLSPGRGDIGALPRLPGYGR